MTLAAVSSTWVQTATADFSAGTVSGTYATNNSVKLLKPFGATCTASTECNDGNGVSAAGVCTAGVCVDPWVTWVACGATSPKVRYADLAGTSVWKTSNTTCDSPQCSGGVLVSDNTVDFSLYTARNGCKAIGGRLPNLAELACIYTNRASYDDSGAFQTDFYWSATENTASNAWLVGFSGGSQSNDFKTNAYYVRCVRGQ